MARTTENDEFHYLHTKLVEVLENCADCRCVSARILEAAILGKEFGRAGENLLLLTKMIQGHVEAGRFPPSFPRGV